MITERRGVVWGGAVTWRQEYVISRTSNQVGDIARHNPVLIPHTTYIISVFDKVLHLTKYCFKEQYSFVKASNIS